MPKTPERAAFGIYPQAGKRGRKPNAKAALEQAFIDERAMELPQFGEVDLSIPTSDAKIPGNNRLAERMLERQADLKRQADEAMSPLEKLAGGIQTGRLIGSGLTQAVKSIPTAITKGGKAAEDYIAENIYQPTQPKAYEYAGDIADFLEQLETKYKLPPVLPEAVAIQSLLGPATRQAGKAVKKGAKQGALNLAAPRTLNPQAGVFIGPKAKTWNQGKADMAVAMEEAGRTPQEIWQATGTFRGADGILRQEIDDRAAKFLSADERKERIEAAKGKIAEMREKIKPTPQKDLFPKALTEAKKEVRDDISILKSDVEQRQNNPRTQGLLAAHIFEHPELYAAYPELQNVKIVTEGGSGGNARGSLSIMPSRGFYPGSMEIDVYDKGLRGDPTSTTLHEMQHAVQTLEGMGPGGNPTFAFQNPEAHGMLHKERMNMLKGLSYDDFVRQAGYTDMEQAGKDYIKYTNDLKKGIDPAYDRMLQERVAMEYYKRLLGEAEARAVQERQMMTPSQRMDTPPPASYDVPQEDLIVKPPREYADGGRVHFSDNPDVMQLELAGGGLIKKAAKAATKAAKAPQEDAMRLAQQRAALPKEKGGLGLPANNTAEQRAKAMGINTDAYHGSKQDITGAFKPGYDDNLAFVTKSPEFANKWIGKGKYTQRSGEQAQQEVKSAEDAYREIRSRNMNYDDALERLKGEEFDNEYDRRRALAMAEAEREFGTPGNADKIHSTVYPLKVEANKTFNPETDMDVMAEFFEKNEIPPKLQELYAGGNYMMYETKPVVEFLKSKGYDSMRLRESTGDDYPTIAVFNPETTRSRFAAFDPFRKDVATATAMGVAAPDLLAKEHDDEQKASGGAVRMGGGGALGKLSAKGSAKGAKEAAVPLSLPRVRPTTKDILEAAERVGKQQAGEFVKSPLTTKTSNLAGRSKKEVDRLKEMEYKLTPIKDLPVMKPYEAKVGEVNIALPGDQTVSDMLLESVDGIPVGTTSEGGALFGRGRLADPEDKRAFWASNIGPADLFQKKVTELAQKYDTDMVTAYHLAMGQMSNNFAQHMADANLRAIDYSKLNKDKMNAFDRVVSKGYIDPTTKERVTFENWPGIASPEDALLAMKEDPKLRKWFNNRMKTEKVTKPLDLPNAKSIEWAMTEPELRNMEINLTGLSAGRMKPGAELIPDSAHQTYSHDIPGTALGRAPELSPFSISFPDATAFVREKYRPQDFTGTIQKVFPHQVVDEAYLEDMYKYYTQLRKVRGFKKGGPVRKAAGGEITADDLILEERKL